MLHAYQTPLCQIRRDQSLVIQTFISRDAMSSLHVPWHLGSSKMVSALFEHWQKDTFIKYFLSILDRNCTSGQLYSPKGRLVLNTVNFTTSCIQRYIHLNIREVKTQWSNSRAIIHVSSPVHTVYNGEKWASLVFTSFLKVCMG